MQGYATCAPNFFRIFLSYLVWRQNFCFVVLGRPESLFSPFFFNSFVYCHRSCTGGTYVCIFPALSCHTPVISLSYTTLSHHSRNIAWRRTWTNEAVRHGWLCSRGWSCRNCGCMCWRLRSPCTVSQYTQILIRNMSESSGYA